MRPLELTRRGILGTVAVLLVAGGCVRLGFWQLDRKAERQARNAVVAERMEAEPMALRSIGDTTGLTYRRVRLTGPIDDDRALILAGRSLNGAPGVHVLSPVRVGDGAVLVNRGWLPSPDAATVDLDGVRLSGSVRAEGVLLPFPETDRQAEPGEFRVTWFRFDGDAIRAQYPYPVAPLYLVATDSVVAPSGDDAGAAGMAVGSATVPVPLDPPGLDPGPHLSYAVQWFSFATVFLVGWTVLVIQGTGRASGPDE